MFEGNWVFKNKELSADPHQKEGADQSTGKVIMKRSMLVLPLAGRLLTHALIFASLAFASGWAFGLEPRDEEGPRLRAGEFGRNWSQDDRGMNEWNARGSLGRDRYQNDGAGYDRFPFDLPRNMGRGSLTEPLEDEYDQRGFDSGRWSPSPVTPAAYETQRPRRLNAGPARRMRPVPVDAVPPTAPANDPAAQPTLEQKISRRYSDPRILRTISGLNGQNRSGFYLEASRLIDERHIAPTSYAERTANALTHLSAAVENNTFKQAMQINPSPRAVQEFQNALADMGQRLNVETAAQSVAVMREVEQLAQTIVRIPAGAVVMEFVYGSLGTLDQYSAFVPPDKNAKPSASLADSIVGIGVEVEGHPDGLHILKALSGGPAARATLRKGDVIYAIDGQSLAGMDLSQAVDLIPGPLGSPIQLSVRRGGQVTDITLTRARVEIKSVSEFRMVDAGQGVAYIKLDSFAEATSKELDAALMSLNQQGMQSLILDLRGNPGGLLTTAIEVTDKFLPDGVIVSTKGRLPQDNTQENAKRPNTWKTPLVVLVDKNSASASEIFAAAIQDHGRGVVVGQRSYGKGTVQTQFPMQSVAGGLKLTTALFYSPNGRQMSGEGVIPDVPVAVAANPRDVSQDRTLDTAIDVALNGTGAEMASGVSLNSGYNRRMEGPRS